MENTLYEYYTSKGQSLPSVKQRTPLATEAGIQNYTGTAEQNTALLAYLKGKNGTNTPNITGVEQPVDIGRLNSTQPYNLPQPEADTIHDTFNESMMVALERERKRYQELLAEKEKETSKELESKRKEEKETVEKMDPTTRPTYTQEQRITQQQLDAAEYASGTLATDLQKRRSFVDEMESILTENNAILKREANVPLSSRVLSKRVSETLRENEARAGVLQATISALDGNMSQAHNIINNARNAVSADWNDRVNYYGTLLNLANRDILRLSDENREYARMEMSLIKEDLDKLDNTVEYIKQLMINPQTARFMADAGIKMTDTIEEINEKLSKQALQEEREQMINDLTMRGYKYVVAPTSTAGLVPITIGGQTLYFRQPVDTKGVTKERKSTLTENERRELFSLGMTSKEIEEFEMSIEMLGLNRALEELKKKYTGGSSTEEQIDSAVDQVREMYLRKIGDTTDYSSMDIVDLETGIRNLLPESELAYIAKKLGYKGGIFSIDSKRVSKMFEGLTRGQMITLIREASRGTSGDETVKLLGSSTEPKEEKQNE